LLQCHAKTFNDFFNNRVETVCAAVKTGLWADSVKYRLFTKKGRFETSLLQIESPHKNLTNGEQRSGKYEPGIALPGPAKRRGWSPAGNSG